MQIASDVAASGRYRRASMYVTGPEEPTAGTPGSLDPEDWNSLRRQAHALLDDCLDFLATVRDRPVWQPVPDAILQTLNAPVPAQPTPLAELLDDCRTRIMPFATGNIHPRFFGWVHGAGTPIGVVAEMIAATMNSNCGGRNHVAIYVERQVIDWVRQIFDFPADSSGVLTVGTSMASVLAVAAARASRLGMRTRLEGNPSDVRLVGYCSAEGHVALVKAFELLGLGSAQLRKVATRADYSLSLPALIEALATDRAAGLTPFIVVGTAGTVNTGAFDDLAALGALCKRERVWFHVDGAFGAWARIAGDPLAGLVGGIETADSLACDFHKWISSPYDAGCVLIRDRAAHRAAFADRPGYLRSAERGLAADADWPCDYGIDLSRGFRALKVWLTLRHFGVNRLGEMIAKNCATARHLGRLVARSTHFELAAPVALNICCLALSSSRSADETNGRVAKLVEDLQLSGVAAPSTTMLAGRRCMRVAILNHRTTDRDVEILLDAAERLAGAAT